MTEEPKEPLPPKASPIKKVEKVFCKDCRYFKTFRGVMDSYREWCMACDTHRAPAESYEGEPKKINDNTACRMFERGRGKHIDLL